MTPADDRLKALFAHEEPPALDAAFSAAVMERLARRRCLAELAHLGGLSVLGGLGLWALWPVLHPAMAAISGELAPTAVGLAVALSAVAILGGQVFQAPAMES